MRGRDLLPDGLPSLDAGCTSQTHHNRDLFAVQNIAEHRHLPAVPFDSVKERIVSQFLPLLPIGREPHNGIGKGLMISIFNDNHATTISF